MSASAVDTSLVAARPTGIRTSTGLAECAFGRVADGALPDRTATTRAKALLARVIRVFGKMLEGGGTLGIDRPSGPLTLDQAWAGGWYGRSRLLQSELLQARLRTYAQPVHAPKSWDDTLD